MVLPVLPGCRGAAGVLPVLPGVAGVLLGVAGLPGTWPHILTAGLGCQAAGYVAGYCRVLPYCRVTAELPGRCRVGAGLGCRVAGARAQLMSRAHAGFCVVFGSRQEQRHKVPCVPSHCALCSGCVWRFALVCAGERAYAL